jgi:hypothetical protein
LPDVAVPLATFTGWALRAPEFGGPDGCEATGQKIPFALTKGGTNGLWRSAAVDRGALRELPDVLLSPELRHQPIGEPAADIGGGCVDDAQSIAQPRVGNWDSTKLLEEDMQDDEGDETTP